MFLYHYSSDENLDGQQSSIKTPFFAPSNTPEQTILNEYIIEIPNDSKIYDLNIDSLELLSPKLEKNEYGVETIKAVSLESVQNNLKKLGYIGYKNIDNSINILYNLPLENLDKIQTPPVFPKLGVHYKPQVPILDEPQHVDRAARAVRNAAFRDVGQDPVKHPKAGEYLKDTKDAWGIASPSTQTRTSYALGPKERAKVVNINSDTSDKLRRQVYSPKAPISIQQHESLHNILLDIQDRYGQRARENLVNNLLNSIPKQYKKPLDEMMEHMHGDVVDPEEKLTHIYNYLNDPEYRNYFHTSKNHSREERRDINNKIKRAARSLNDVAQIADTNWLKSELNEDDLQKGWKQAALLGAAALASNLISAPTHPNTESALNNTIPKIETAKPKQETEVKMPKELSLKPLKDKSKLSPELDAISMLESSGGKFVNHAPHSKGIFHTAVGSVGFKPITAFDVYNRHNELKAAFPNLTTPDKFLEAFKTNSKLYNTLANYHWRDLFRSLGSPEKAAFGWRHGVGAAHKADTKTIESDPYVSKFNRLLATKKSETFDYNFR
ncbi:MAG: hypothetical protein KGO96_07285 [Elusimicrobia bacterium]|nr:hypothetical protein [Elusimicrobiota bacterium]